MNPAPPRFPCRRRALVLVELLVSLAICAALLLAIGAAFVSASAAVEVNDEFFRATQAARLAVTQLETAIRRCDSCEVPNSGRINLITPEGADRSYVYDATTKRLLLVTNHSVTDPDYVLARNVTSMSFAADSDLVPGSTTVTQVVRVTINLDLQVGDEQVHLSGSAVPRRTVTPETQ